MLMTVMWFVSFLLTLWWFVCWQSTTQWLQSCSVTDHQWFTLS